MKPVELVKLNLAIEADLQNLVHLLIESVKRLHGNVFRAALACLNLNRRLRTTGACSGLPFPASICLQNKQLRVHWENNEFVFAQIDSAEPQAIEQLCDYLCKFTNAIDPEILIQRNDAMVRHLHETRARTERELAELEVKLHLRQAELQVSLHQAETDPLTGLFNRRAFNVRLDQAFRHTMRQKNLPLSLIMLDLDFFKSINDQHGHQHGDRHLINMSKILRSEIREDVDYAFRFGGDEFSMLLYADYTTACYKARQILEKMDGKVSIGIASLDQNTMENLALEEFIHQADSALYEAKHRGRGRVVVAKCSKLDSQLCKTICTVKATRA